MLLLNLKTTLRRATNMKMTHKQKVKLARKMQTKEEAREKGKGIFLSLFWQSKKEAMKKRLAEKEKRDEHARKS